MALINSNGSRLVVPYEIFHKASGNGLQLVPRAFDPAVKVIGRCIITHAHVAQVDPLKSFLQVRGQGLMHFALQDRHVTRCNPEFLYQNFPHALIAGGLDDGIAKEVIATNADRWKFTGHFTKGDTDAAEDPSSRKVS